MIKELIETHDRVLERKIGMLGKGRQIILSFLAWFGIFSVSSIHGKHECYVVDRPVTLEISLL